MYRDENCNCYSIKGVVSSAVVSTGVTTTTTGLPLPFKRKESVDWRAMERELSSYSESLIKNEENRQNEKAQAKTEKKIFGHCESFHWPEHFLAKHLRIGLIDFRILNTTPFMIEHDRES